MNVRFMGPVDLSMAMCPQEKRATVRLSQWNGLKEAAGINGRSYPIMTETLLLVHAYPLPDLHGNSHG